jgi:hypothetical protein
VLTRHDFRAILPTMEQRGEKTTSDVAFSPRGSLDMLIAELATLQHGVVALGQLLDIGLSARAVQHRVDAGRLHRIHRGVYAVGHARLTLDGRYMAAVLACRPDGALSHRSSAHKRGLRNSDRSKIDVITSRRAGRGLAGIDAHTSSTLLPRDIQVVDGIRCTSVARTLLDLAAVLPRRAVERAFDQAEVLEVVDARQIDDVLARAGRHRGAGVLRAILDEHSPGSTLTRNTLEEAFLAICDRAGLPRPEVNVWTRSSRSATRPTSSGARKGSSRRQTAERRTAPAGRSCAIASEISGSRSPGSESSASRGSRSSTSRRRSGRRSASCSTPRSARGGSRSARARRDRACRACA